MGIRLLVEAWFLCAWSFYFTVLSCLAFLLRFDMWL